MRAKPFCVIGYKVSNQMVGNRRWFGTQVEAEQHMGHLMNQSSGDPVLVVVKALRTGRRAAPPIEVARLTKEFGNA
jgi:hypothetical protein